MKLNPIIKTGKNYYDSLAEIPKGSRMTTAAEELALQLQIERSGKDPRKAVEFKQLFPKNGWLFQWTATTLRVKHGYPEKVIEKKGRKYYLRQVLIGDVVVGEAWIPEDGIVTKWNEKFGIPSETINKDIPHDKHTTHFWFNSDVKEVAVARFRYWLHDEVVRCLIVDVVCGRFDAVSDGAFRPVRGSVKLPKHKCICQCGKKVRR